MSDLALTPEQVAERLQVKRNHVYTLIHSGKLIGRRVGVGISNLRVLESDLQAFLEGAIVAPQELRQRRQVAQAKLKVWRFALSAKRPPAADVS